MSAPSTRVNSGGANQPSPGRKEPNNWQPRLLAETPMPFEADWSEFGIRFEECPSGIGVLTPKAVSYFFQMVPSMSTPQTPAVPALTEICWIISMDPPLDLAFWFTNSLVVWS